VKSLRTVQQRNPPLGRLAAIEHRVEGGQVDRDRLASSHAGA
jgi:hypothetical protein